MLLFGSAGCKAFAAGVLANTNRGKILLNYTWRRMIRTAQLTVQLGKGLRSPICDFVMLWKGLETPQMALCGAHRSRKCFSRAAYKTLTKKKITALFSPFTAVNCQKGNFQNLSTIIFLTAPGSRPGRWGDLAVTEMPWMGGGSRDILPFSLPKHKKEKQKEAEGGWGDNKSPQYWCEPRRGHRLRHVSGHTCKCKKHNQKKKKPKRALH